MTTYAATKAGVAHLVEGLRTEFYGKPGYDFTVLYPGYIASEMNDGVAAAENRMMVSTEKGVARDGVRHREAAGVRLRPAAAVGAAVGGPEARPAAGLPR